MQKNKQAQNCLLVSKKTLHYKKSGGDAAKSPLSPPSNTTILNKVRNFLF
jgi:hypothetical protein